MAQGMDAAELGDAGGVAGHVVVALAAGTVQMARRVRARREQPSCAIGMAATGAPIQPQLREQVRIEQAIPILPALALDHADAHPIGGRVDVATPQAAQLAQAQTTGVGCHQKGARLHRHRRAKQGCQLGARQDLG